MDTQQFCAMAYLDCAADAQVRRLQSIAGTASDAAPHITFGIYEGIPQTALENWARVFCRTHAPLVVHFTHIGIFDSRVLFLAPRVSEDLLFMHRAFHARFDRNASPAGQHYSLYAQSWVPHTTLMLGESGDILSALSGVQEAFTPFDAQLSCIQIAEFQPFHPGACTPFRSGNNPCNTCARREFLQMH